jgi:putative nucleotidyltransferase with HDIG domain
MPQIRIKTGHQKGKVIQIDGDKPLILGRDAQATFQILDKGVSRAHAEIFRVGEMVFIRDLNSRNGSLVNGETIKEELLREGDLVRIGSTQIVFESTRANRRTHDVEFDESDMLQSSLELKIEDLFAEAPRALSSHGDQHFAVLCQATGLMHSESNESKRYELLLDLIQEHLPADHLYVFLKDDETGNIIARAVRQKDTSAGVPISRTILKRVIAESKAIMTADAMKDDRFKTGDSIVLHHIRSVLCVPIQTPGGALGAIYAVNSRLAETFDPSDLELLSSICLQLGNLLGAQSLLLIRQRTFIGLAERLLQQLAGNVSDAIAHAERVSEYAAATAREMGLLDSEVLTAQLAGLLHDIGKLPGIAGPDAVLERPGDVSHARRSADMFKDVKGFDAVREAIADHHERFDGRGEQKLKGESIPLIARIVAAADAFDHLIARFPRHGSVEPDAAALREMFNEFEALGETQLDPDVIRAVMLAFRAGDVQIGRRQTAGPGQLPAPAAALFESEPRPEHPGDTRIPASQPGDTSA